MKRDTGESTIRLVIGMCQAWQTPYNWWSFWQYIYFTSDLKQWFLACRIWRINGNSSLRSLQNLHLVSQKGDGLVHTLYSSIRIVAEQIEWLTLSSLKMNFGLFSITIWSLTPYKNDTYILDSPCNWSIRRPMTTSLAIALGKDVALQAVRITITIVDCHTRSWRIQVIAS